MQLRMRTLERKKSSASRLANGGSRLNSQQGGGGSEKNEFDDLISALRTGDVFGENMDKFRRNRFEFVRRQFYSRAGDCGSEISEEKQARQLCRAQKDL